VLTTCQGRYTDTDRGGHGHGWQQAMAGMLTQSTQAHMAGMLTQATQAHMAGMLTQAT